MTLSRPVTYRNLTPDEVLAELKRFCEDWGFHEKDVVKYVHPEASLRELVAFEPEADWGELNTKHGLTMPDEESLTKLKPDATVGDLCRAVSELTVVPVVEPLTILGKACETAGAFLTLKQMLADDGADVSQLGPSSDVQPYWYDHPEVFQRFRLAFAERLPLFHRPMGFWFGCLGAILPSVICALIVERTPWLVTCCTVVTLLLTGALWYGSRCLPRVNGQRLKTFRELIPAALGQTSRPAAAM